MSHSLTFTSSGSNRSSELDRLHEAPLGQSHRRGKPPALRSPPTTNNGNIKVVAVYIAGEALGALTQTFVGDRMGRIRFMQLLCVLVTIGTAIQTFAVHIAMFLLGRALAGFAVG
jgi:MFS family permease